MEQEPDSLTREVDAMAVIGQVLSKLTDPAARQRVLKWAAERFAVDGAPVAQTAVSPRVARPAPVDPGLTIDSLDDMFAIAAPEVVSNPPVESVLQSFAADFQRFADDWNGATA
jgi:hypothetical protein